MRGASLFVMKAVCYDCGGMNPLEGFGMFLRYPEPESEKEEKKSMSRVR